MTLREQLAAAIGERSTAKLLHQFEGKVVRFPSARSQTSQLRNQRVVEALSCQCGNRKHHSNAAVARRFNLSQRQVIKIGKRPEGPDTPDRQSAALAP